MSGPTNHQLLWPPHPGDVYLASALCSCGEWQWDAHSEAHLFAQCRTVMRAHTTHATEADATILELRAALAETGDYYDIDGRREWHDRNCVYRKVWPMDGPNDDHDEPHCRLVRRLLVGTAALRDPA